MDIDRYLAVNEPAWARLRELTASTRARRGAPAAELDELVTLYQRTATQLSYCRTHFRDPALSARLTRLVADAHAVVYGSRPRTMAAVGRFLTRTFPAAVWLSRRFVVAAAVLTFGPAVVLGAWLANSDAALEASAPAAVREAYVQDDFEDYYSSEPAAQFASEVFVNNITVSIYAFAAGILLCGLTAYILALNGANLGVAAGLFAAAGQSGRFWGLIIPHGFLELSAVVVAGAAGLRLGWTVIDPGDRTRGRALAEEGRRSVVLVFGVIVALAVAGFIEGFVTGRGFPTGLRVGLGLAAGGLFWAWVVVLGRRAVAEGATGLLADDDRRIRSRARPTPVTAGP